MRTPIGETDERLRTFWSSGQLDASVTSFQWRPVTPTIMDKVQEWVFTILCPLQCTRRSVTTSATTYPHRSAKDSEPGAVSRLTESIVTHDAGPSGHARDQPAKTVSSRARKKRLVCFRVAAVTDPWDVSVGPAGHQEHTKLVFRGPQGAALW